MTTWPKNTEVEEQVERRTDPAAVSDESGVRTCLSTM